jgi:signal transduction histidine kinase/CHASE2 domain-containing sensor protein
MGVVRAIGRRWLPRLLVFAAVTAGYFLGAFEPAERALMDERFRLVEREASGDLVVVEIDPRSLRSLDTWPWPRTYHARLLDRLIAAGASDVALDIDFSATSTPGADRELAAALSRAEGRAILPAFAQTDARAGRPGRITYTYPAADFREHARIGAVNVFTGPDSLVRLHSPGIRFDGAPLASSPALLFGAPPASVGDFYLDFGIRPESIPGLSYVDVLEGRFDPTVVAGKKVIVGATAVELGDQFAVPVRRAMAGPLLQALAYESLRQNRALRRSGAVPTLFLALVMLAICGTALASGRWRRGFGVLLIVTPGLFAVSVALQAAAPLSLDIAPACSGLLLLYGGGILREVERLATEMLRHRLSDMRRRAMIQGVLEDSFDGIIVTGADGTVELANPAACRLLGHAREAMRGRPIDLFLPGASWLHEGLGAGAAAAPPPDLQLPIERALAHPDGTAMTIEHVASCSYLQVSGRGRKAGAAAPRVFVHTFRDISERKAAEHKMRHAMAEAVAGNRAKTEFLANMSHELRTPLNAIIGFSEIIQKEMLGPIGNARYRDYACDIAYSGTHLLDIINDILDLSKIEAGQFAARDESIDLAAVVERCLTLIGGKAAAAELTVRREIAADLPPLLADARLIRQLVLNLVSNAVKFTPPGGAVTIGVRIHDGRVVLRVADTGIGIPAEELPKVAKPFYQIDSGLARKREGTGLGLALVSTYCKLHQAELTIDSDVGRGTVVTVRFPRTRTLVDLGEPVANPLRVVSR